MTKQEAISVLETIDAKTDYFLINDDARAEAIDMAIEALKAQDVPDTNVGDMVSRRGAIEAVSNWLYDRDDGRSVDQLLSALPSAQSDIIRCNACKHWTQTTGNMHGFGLGDCDYFNVKLVSCNGFCYWAERRTDE